MTAGPRGLSFGTMAEEYDRWRPGYPAAAVEWLAPPTPATVVEIGAGTGRLTTLLLARGLDVDAVEPDPRMRAVLARNNPDARRHASDSTALPVPEEWLESARSQLQVVCDAAGRTSMPIRHRASCTRWTPA